MSIPSEFRSVAAGPVPAGGVAACAGTHGFGRGDELGPVCTGGACAPSLVYTRTGVSGEGTREEIQGRSKMESKKRVLESSDIMPVGIGYNTIPR